MSEELKALKKQLLKDDRNGYDVLSAADLEKMEAYCTVYKAFLDAGKTERLSARAAIALAEKHGFVEYKRGMSLSAGDKVYSCNRGKGLVLAVVGRRSLAEGAQITAAHIDSPRLDLKPTPLYEDSELAYFKTHYYGGVRKYQWVTIPLELRGTVVLRDGSVVDVCIGEGDEPKLVITDLLPHLGAEQSKKPLSEAIPGETLNILLGSRPLGDDDDSDRVKMQVLKRLYDKYGITEADFASAELETVPAVNATDIGLDGSLIGAYGHDDRVCSYPALTALLESRSAHTSMVILADKEEIGSEGTTGMQCKVFEDVMDEISLALGASPRQVRAASKCLSADVTAGYDPNFSSVFEKNNSSLVSYGASLCKFTGSGGKSGSSDASAEFVGEIRRIFADNGVVWQTSELGKVDAGGGGTVAKFLAKLNIDTVDIGVPVISMHAPYELISKADLYSTYQAFAAFFK